MNFKISYKGYIKSVLIISVSIYAILFVLVKIIVDPYNEFNLFELEINKTTYTVSRKITPYLLSDKLIEHKYNLVFGTSRSALVDNEILGAETLNLSPGVYGNPTDVYHFLSTLSEQKLNNINTIYYLVDYHVFNTKKSYYEDFSYPNTLFLRLINSLKTFHINDIESAYTTVKYNLQNYTGYKIGENGNDIFSKEFLPSKKENFLTFVHTEPLTFSSKSFQDLKRLNEFCIEHKIPITYFNFPIYSKYLKTFDMNEIEKQMGHVLESVKEVYELRYTPSISNDFTMFSSVNHVNYTGLKEAMKYFQEDNLINKNNIVNSVNTKIKKLIVSSNLSLKFIWTPFILYF